MISALIALNSRRLEIDSLAMRLTILLLAFPIFATAQSAEYQQKKAEKLAVPSPFERVIAEAAEGENRVLEYEDDDIVAFEPLRLQAPVHFLIVPKRRIPTVNDLAETDAELVGKMVLVAQQLAKKHGIDETGYRLVFNTNEDSGQSVFHIHLHLLGGKKLGPMVEQE